MATDTGRCVLMSVSIFLKISSRRSAWSCLFASCNTPISMSETLLLLASISPYPITSVPGSMPKIMRDDLSKKSDLTKSTKIWLNSLLGLSISILLFFSIWLQVRHQHAAFSVFGRADLAAKYLGLALLLMPLNLGLEIFKWKMLANSAQPVSVSQAVKSYCAGIAISLITPNRIGEYPGRMLYLKSRNTIRLISVSLLGAFTQLLTLFLFGSVGLLQYNLTHPGYGQKLLLAFALGSVMVLGILFFRFEKWITLFEKHKRLRRLRTYGQLLRRFTRKEQLSILLISMLRFGVFCTQYLLLLRWMNIDMLSARGFLTATLYFWGIAVVPSIAFAELGVRGKLSLFLLSPFTDNVLGILAATFGLWCINLIVPALAGSVLLWRVKLIRN